MKQLYASNFEELKTVFSLSEEQLNQFKNYSSLLAERAAEYNLTTRTTEQEIIEYHFTDSLAASVFFPFSASTGCVDVGSGAGFPGIPLKILYPNLPMTLIEVLSKRRKFLAEVIDTLKLTNITLYEHDWRQFLRTTNLPANFFLARASLACTELIRLFQPSSPYQKSSLLYWSSEEWTPEKKTVGFYEKSFWYKLPERTRHIALLKKRIE